jgi:hypothetical protein
MNFKKLLVFVTLIIVAFASNAQPWTYDFGTSTGTYNTASGVSTSFLPTPPTNGGTASVRVGTTAGSFVMANPGSPIGTNSDLVITAPTSTSLNKFAVYDWTNTGNVFSFKSSLYLSGTSGSLTGTWYFFIGNGTSFNTGSSGFTGSNIFTGLRFVMGGTVASPTCTTTYRTSSAWVSTGLTTTGITGNTSLALQIFGNNSGSTQTYTFNGICRTVATTTWDIYLGTTLIGDDIAGNSAYTGGNFDSFMFYGESSTSNIATLAVDDITYGPVLPTPTLVVNPASLAAFSTTQGTPSAEQSYTLTGSNLCPLAGNLSVAALSGYEYSTTSGGPYSSSLTIPYTGGAYSGTIYVRLTGASSGPFNGNIVNSGGTTTAQNVAVTGTVNSPQEIDVQYPVATSIANNGTAADFGTYAVSSNNDFTFRVRNTGGTNLSVTGVTFGGTNSGDFSLVGTAAQTIAGAAFYDYTVRFTPGAPGARTGTITFANNDSNEGTYLINISGSGAAANSITTGAVSTSPFCVSANNTATGTVAYSTGGGPYVGTFTAALIASDGTTIVNANIGTGASPINITIPAGTTAGSYFVRVSNSSPAVTGTNSASITVNSLTNVTGAGATAGNAQVDVNWTNPNCFDNVIIVRHTATISGTPSGSYLVNDAFPGGGTVVYSGQTSPQTFTGLTNGTPYFFKIFAFKGTSTRDYASGVQVTATPVAPATLTALPILLSGFSTTVGTASTSQNYTLTGSNLSPANAVITVSAPNTDWQVSNDNSTWGATTTATAVGGSLSQVIYARISTTAPIGSPSGNITHAGGTVATPPTVALSGTVTVAPPTVVINKVFNSSSSNLLDAVELLVIQNNLDMRGMIVKDYTNAGGVSGVFTLSTNALWSSVPAGTLIRIINSNSGTSADTDYSDFTLDMNRAQALYFTSSGSFDLATNDIVMIQAAGSNSANTTGAINTLRYGNDPDHTTVITGTPGYVLSTGTSIAGNDYVIANNATSALIDFNGANASISTTQVFLTPNNTTNATYICSLRGSSAEPTVVATGVNFSSVGPAGMTVQWTNPGVGGGARRIVVARLTSTTAVPPTDNTTYTTSTVFSSPNGTTGTGNVVVYDGTGTSVAVTGLSSGISYTFDIYEYNGTSFCANYYGTAASNAQTTVTATLVQFVSATASVGEAAGTYNVTLSISNPSTSNATTGQINFLSGSSTGTAADIGSFSVGSFTFPANSSANVTVSVTITDDGTAESPDEFFVFDLQNVAGGTSAGEGSPNQFTLTINDNDGPCLIEGFAAGTTAPSGWAFTAIGGTYTSGGNFGVASPSLQFDNTNDAITTTTVANPSQLSFWYKGQGTDANSYLLVQGLNGGTWQTIDSIRPLANTGTSMTYVNNINSFNQFRFTYTKSAGNLALDDVTALCGVNVVPTNNYQSAGNGDWNNAASWEVFSGSWIPATTPPDFNANNINILSGHTITVTQNVTTDQTTVNSGGTLVINPTVRLTINDGTGAGADLTVNGTLTDKSTGSNGLYLSGADPRWVLGATGTFIKEGTSSANVWQCTYLGADAQCRNSAIPATSTWIIRQTGTTVSLSSTYMYYGNLKIENTSVNAWSASLAQGFQGGTSSEAPVIKGNFDIGVTGNAVSFNVANTNTNPVRVDGNITVGNGSALNLGTSGQTTTGIEVKGNVSFSTTGSLTYGSSSASNRQIRLTGTAQQTISGGGTVNILNMLVSNSSAQGVVMGRNIKVDNQLTLNTGSKLNVNGNTLELAGTITGTGTLSGNNTSTLNITGTGALGTLFFTSGSNTFRTVSLNKTSSGSAIIGSGVNTLNIYQNLDLVAGALTTNGNLTTLSSSVQTAYINDFTSGYAGTISGNVSVERFIPPSPNGFRYIGQPVNTGAGVMAISAMQGFTVTGSPGQTIPLPTCSPTFTPLNVAVNSPYGNLMYFQENGPYGSPACRQRGWWFQTTGSLTVGRGYGIKQGGNTKITYRGTANTGTITSAATNTHTSIFSPASNNGWNLVSNPYPSAIIIDETGGNPEPLNDMPAGFDKQIQLYITGNTNLTGSYQPVNIAITQAANIALGQGFWVRVTTPGTTPAWTLGQGHRTTASPTYFDVNPLIESHLKVNVSGNGFADLSNIYFVKGAEAGLDIYDGNKWSSATGQPTLYTKAGEEVMGINSLPSLSETMAVPMGLTPGANGNFTFTFEDIASFPQTAMIYLEDLKLGTMNNLRDNATYEFAANLNDNPDRFMLHFQPGLQAEVADQDCDNAGSIELTQPAPTVWSTYEVKGNDNNVYATGTNLTGTLTVSNLPAQEYVVTVTHPSGYSAQEYITVNGSSPINATINASATNVQVDEMVSLTANTTNASEYVWNFGDGNTQTGSANVVHAYDAAGVYNVTLVAANSDCNNTTQKTITVGNTTTGIENTNAGSLNILGQGNHVVLEFSNLGADKANLTVFNMLGQQVDSFTGISTVNGRAELSLTNVVSGYYLVRVLTGNKVYNQKLLLGSN